MGGRIVDTLEVRVCDLLHHSHGDSSASAMAAPTNNSNDDDADVVA